MDRQGHEQRRREAGARFPHHVDLVPPLAGFDDSVEEEIMQFLRATCRHVRFVRRDRKRAVAHFVAPPVSATSGPISVSGSVFVLLKAPAVQLN
jgi:hypothetical protein